jgi:GAF domain-containing protein/DNA-binding CsgD family transcriptional regulator
MEIEILSGHKLKKEQNMEQNSERLAKEMEIIAEIGRIIGSTLKIEEVYEKFASEARKLIPFDRVTINLNDFENQTIYQAYVYGMEVEGRGVGASMPLSDSVNEKMLSSRKGFLINLRTAATTAKEYPNLVAPFKSGIRSILAIPLIARDQVIGGLNFQAKQKIAYFQQDLQLGEGIGAQVAGAISNAQLFLAHQKAETALLKAHEELEVRVRERTREITQANIALQGEIAERKRAEAALKKRERELRIKSRHLEEMNSALKVLLKQRDADIAEVGENVLSNVRELVYPFLEKIKKSHLAPLQAEFLSIVESNLEGILSPFLKKLTSRYLNLTPKEVKIAHLIKEEKTTKEIAEIMNVSTKTIDFHRANIRQKLSLKSKKINLGSYLSSFS